MNKHSLLLLAVVLLLIWVAASVTKFVVGGLLHLIWIAALVMLVLWAYRRIRG